MFSFLDVRKARFIFEIYDQLILIKRVELLPQKTDHMAVMICQRFQLLKLDDDPVSVVHEPIWRYLTLINFDTLNSAKWVQIYFLEIDVDFTLLSYGQIKMCLYIVY